MVGPRLFRSRWTALLWAGGVMWTAYDLAVATKEDAIPTSAKNAPVATDATGLVTDGKDLAVLANAGDAN